MLRRKTPPIYLLYSLVLHFVLVLVVWWVVPKPVPEDPFYDKIEIFIANFKPAPIAKPKEFVKPPAPVVDRSETATTAESPRRL